MLVAQLSERATDVREVPHIYTSNSDLADRRALGQPHIQILDEPDASNRRGRLLQQLHPLLDEVCINRQSQSRRVPTGASQTHDNTVVNWIACCDENNGNGLRQILHGQGHWASCCDDHINIHPDEFPNECGGALASSVPIPIFNGEVLAVDIAKVTQPLTKCFNFRRSCFGRASNKNSETTNLLRLLSLGGERRGEHGSQPSDERATVHRLTGTASITEIEAAVGITAVRVKPAA